MSTLPPFFSPWSPYNSLCSVSSAFTLMHVWMDPFWLDYLTISHIADSFLTPQCRKFLTYRWAPLSDPWSSLQCWLPWSYPVLAQEATAAVSSRAQWAWHSGSSYWNHFFSSLETGSALYRKQTVTEVLQQGVRNPQPLMFCSLTSCVSLLSNSDFNNGIDAFVLFHFRISLLLNFVHSPN